MARKLTSWERKREFKRWVNRRAALCILAMLLGYGAMYLAVAAVS